MLNVENIRDYCLAKTLVTESMPFGPEVLVFKVYNKVFCLLSLDAQPVTLNVKCDPEQAVELRERYSSVLPGYHMNKTHWNTIVVDGTLSDKLILEFINDSYTIIENAAKPKSNKKNKL